MSSTAKQCTAPDTAPAAAGRTVADGPRTLSPPPVAQLFMHAPRAVRRARGFIARTLHHWGVTERATDVLLCTAELAANACEHTRPGADQFLVRVLLSQGTLRIEVHDRDPRRPSRRAPDDQASSGRGLILVKDLADGCGIDPKPADGKAVWAHFDVSGGRSECSDSSPAALSRRR
jgi:anti-sigma regulatory factor (Ser/Thr protein kinase)